MLKIKVFASNITNLTDARYFAAWEVECLGFNFTQKSESYIAPQSMKAIKEWVEGVSFAGEFPFATIEDINESIELLEIDTVQVGMFTEVDVLEKISNAKVIKEVVITNEMTSQDLEQHLEKYTHHVDMFLLSFEKNGITWEMLKDENSNLVKALLEKICNQYKIILSINFTKENLDEIISIPNIYGINVKGGEEEKVGVKSFDELDEIFEALEVLI